ncbi:MAG: hypothetical protein MMC23_007835 [Stictis urceolatum]|nr:hypothetical protein [Stictis urceolata]
MSSGHSSMNAPLPSPTATKASQHFISPTSQQRSNPDQNQAQVKAELQVGSQAQAVNPGAIAAAAAAQQVAANSSEYYNARDTSSPFRKDLNLVAEAAKRAQMSVLMRDMGDVAL